MPPSGHDTAAATAREAYDRGMRIPVVIAALILGTVVACGGAGAGDLDAAVDADAVAAVDATPDADAAAPTFVPADAVDLTADNPAEDEDPSVLVTADGLVVVTFFSRRGGNADLYVTTTRDGVTWTAARRLTSDPDDDFYPQLIQDHAGRFHLTWFRRAPAPTYYAHVRHASFDALPAAPIDGAQVTDAPGYLEDWVPTIAEAPSGRLVIVFASKLREPDLHHLFAITSDDGGATWSAPVGLADVNAVAAHDHLPFVARTDDVLTLTWVRHETDPTPWLDATSDVMLATSSDGLAWSSPRAVTADDGAGVVDVFPGLYRRHGGAWALAWVSTALAPGGSVVAVAVADAATYPSGRVELPLVGYSPRIVATPTPGVYLGVTVAGATGAQDVYARVFTE